MSTSDSQSVAEELEEEEERFSAGDLDEVEAEEARPEQRLRRC